MELSSLVVIHKLLVSGYLVSHIQSMVKNVSIFYAVWGRHMVAHRLEMVIILGHRLDKAGGGCLPEP